MRVTEAKIFRLNNPKGAEEPISEGEHRPEVGVCLDGLAGVMQSVQDLVTVMHSVKSPQERHTVLEDVERVVCDLRQNKAQDHGGYAFDPERLLLRKFLV